MKKLKNILFSLCFILPCLLFCGCGDNEASIIKIGVSLADINKTIEDNTLTYTYGDEININTDQFVVTATYDNGVTGTLNLITESNPVGYFRETNLPNITPIPAGEYYLKFQHSTLTPVELTIIVEKAKLDMTGVKWDYSSPLTYNTNNQSVKLINLPENVEAVYNGNTAKNTGKYTAVASYNFDRDNYEMINNSVKQLDWEIKKCPINLKNTTWDYSTAFNYDGLDKTITLKNLPENLNVEYKGNKGNDAGLYTASCKFNFDTNNYELVNNNIKDCSWEIKKAPVQVENIDQLLSALENDSFNKIEIIDSIEISKRINVNKDIIIGSGCSITLSENTVEVITLETMFNIQNNAKITQYVSTIQDLVDAFNYADKIILDKNLEAESLDEANLTFIAQNKDYNITIDLNGHNLKYNFMFTNIYLPGLEATTKMTIRFTNSISTSDPNIKYYLGYSNDNSNIAVSVDGNNEFYIYLPIQVAGSNITLNGVYEIAERDGQPRGNIITNSL